MKLNISTKGSMIFIRSPCSEDFAVWFCSRNWWRKLPITLPWLISLCSEEFADLFCWKTHNTRFDGISFDSTSAKKTHFS